MANEIRYAGGPQAGGTLYAVANTPAGLFIKTADGSTEAYNAADWGLYAITLATTGPYTFGSLPSGSPALPVVISIFETAPSTAAAVGDALRASYREDAVSSGSAQTGDVYALVSPLIATGKFTAPALSLAPTGGGSVTDTSVQADVVAALTAQGYTSVRAAFLDTLNGLVTAIWAAATRTLTAFGFAVPSVTAPVSLPTTPPAGYGGGSVTDTSIQADALAALTSAGVQTSLAAITTSLATINTALPGIPAAAATALLTHIVAHGLTVGQTLAELTDPLNDAVVNTWNATTHVLTTVYSFGTTGVPDVTTVTQYPTTQVLAPPVLGRTTTVGTIPQP